MVIVQSREREFRHSTDAIEYCIEHTELLAIANASHQCLAEFSGLTTVTGLHFRLQPRSSSPHTVPLPVELFISEEEREEDEEAVLCPRMRPATRASITELLLKAKAAAEEDADCGICMEGIQKDRVLRMPCSHPFHRLCLLHWLDNGHSCPICRYQLPAAQHLSDVTDTP